jgi:aminoglycoside 6-adenylyltransferase
MAVNLTYDTLIELIEEWAMTRNDIRLGVVIGSLARSDRPADVWSDLDVLLFTTDPALYLSESGWLAALGNYHLTFLEPTAVGEFFERRVLFDGGLDVDFIPLPAYVIQGEVPQEMSEVLRRGYRVLFDKDGLSSKLESASVRTTEGNNVTSQLPSLDSFEHLVNDFLYHAVWSAKKLCRGELWTAKMCCDGYMKRQLLQAIEWYQRATKGEIWHEGRFLDSRVDPSVLEELRGAFAIYELNSVWEALHSTIDLFGRVCRDLGKQLGYSYPSTGHEYVLGLLREYQSTNSTNVVPQTLHKTGFL